MNPFHSLLLFFLCSASLYAQDPSLTPSELDSIATSFAEQQQYEKAVQYAKVAIKQTQTKVGKKDSLYARALERLGVIYYDMYKDAEAGIIFEEVASIYKKVYGKNHNLYATALKSVGVIEASLKNYAKAEYIYHQVEPIYKQLHGEQSSKYAFLLGDFAVLYDNWNREELAESMYLRSIEIEKQVLGENNVEHALSLSNFAIYYSKYGYYNKAISLHQQALTIYKKVLGTEHSKYAHALTNLGITYSKNENYNKAIKVLLQASIIYAKIYGKNHPRYARLISDLATIYTLTEDYPKAEALHLESLAIHNKNNKESITQKIVIYRKIASFYRKTKQFSKALEYGFKAIYHNSTGKVDTSSLKKLLHTASLYKFRDPDAALSTINNIAITFYNQYQIDKNLEWLYKSQFCYKAILAYMDNYKNQFVFKRDKFRVLKKMSPIIDSQIQTLLALNAIDKNNNKYLLDIFKLIEQNKSILLMDALQNKKNKTFGNLPDSLLNKENALQKKFDELQKIKLVSVDSTQLSILTKQTAQLNIEIKDFKTYLKASYPKYYTFNYSPQNIDLDKIQTILKPKELLVEYFIGEKYFYVFSISKKKHELQNDSF